MTAYERFMSKSNVDKLVNELNKVLKFKKGLEMDRMDAIMLTGVMNTAWQMAMDGAQPIFRSLPPLELLKVLNDNVLTTLLPRLMVSAGHYKYQKEVAKSRPTPCHGIVTNVTRTGCEDPAWSIPADMCRQQNDFYYKNDLVENNVAQPLVVPWNSIHNAKSTGLVLYPGMNPEKAQALPPYLKAMKPYCPYGDKIVMSKRYQ
jgi:hypothetical protein